MRLIKAPTFLLIIFVLLNSCVSNIDLDKIDELTLTPVLNSPLFSFELDQSKFVDEVNNVEVLTFTDITPFDVFSREEIAENLLEMTIGMYVDNDIDRRFNVEIEFLDEDDNITVDFVPLNIGPNEKNLNFSQRIAVYRSPVILSTRKIRFTVRMISNGNLLDTTLDNKLRFRSVGTYLFNTMIPE